MTLSARNTWRRGRLCTDDFLVLRSAAFSIEKQDTSLRRSTVRTAEPSLSLGNPYREGRLCTLDILVLTSLDKVLFILRILFNFFTKQGTVFRRSTVPNLPF
jgi:hypothetical protein